MKANETLIDCLEKVSENALSLVENNQSLNEQLEDLLKMYEVKK
jgi:hypothetical protein